MPRADHDVDELKDIKRCLTDVQHPINQLGEQSHKGEFQLLTGGRKTNARGKSVALCLHRNKESILRPSSSGRPAICDTESGRRALQSTNGQRGSKRSVVNKLLLKQQRKMCCDRRLALTHTEQRT